MEEKNILDRKNDHIKINLEKEVQSALTSGFEDYRLLHHALPEINLKDVDTSQYLFGKLVRIPLLISSMTGGTEKAGEINLRLAESAQKYGIVMGVGSQRAAIDNPNLATTFQIRKYAPSILLFANLGLVQFNYGYGAKEAQRAVDMIGADALFLHLNPLQEAIQIQGDTDFRDLLRKIEIIVKNVNVPVIIKEVGWGISSELVRKFASAGVAGVDVSGAGGTSWSQVERFRLNEVSAIRVAEAFIDWGIPTAQALSDAVKLSLDMNIFASGGIQSGMDVAKSIAMGAKLAGMAGTLLKKAVESSQALDEEIEIISRILRIAMFATGSKNIEAFQNKKIMRLDR